MENSGDPVPLSNIPIENPIDPDEKPTKGKRFKWLLITVAGILALILIALVSAFGGYRSGISIRQGAEATQIVQVVAEQYELGVQDMQSGAYQRARQRFEYVIQFDPNYPGVTEKLADVLVELNTTATPTLVPTPTLTPTPDTRGIEELFANGGQYLTNGEWTNTIDALLNLRKDDPEYRAVEIDGMLFLAFRNRGIDKITKEADLEGGIYDLTLAERFGLLDTEAQSLKSFSSLYITGASFWGLDWTQAAYYFSQVAPHVPNLTDGSGWSAAERYRLAIVGYGDQLSYEGRWCKAAEQYHIALSISYDPVVEQALKTASESCEKGNKKPSEDQPVETQNP
jgi:tetratricopeptide (TPR) repeat protein